MQKIQTQSEVKKKRVSKKSKESWRKHIDISDVNKFLEDQRLEERIGKLSDKSNDELFTIDVNANPKLLTARHVRKLVGLRPPRCFASLENTSKVPDPIAKRNHVRSQEERKHFMKKVENRTMGIISNREKQSTEDRLNAYRKQDARKKEKPNHFAHDIWTTGSLKEQRTDFKGAWIDRNVTEHNLYNTGTPIANAPKSAFHKRSRLNAIPIPHPGISYNPTFKDHQNLISSVLEQEQVIIKREEHLNRVTTSMFKKVTADQRDLNHLAEFNAILNDDDDEKEIQDVSDTPYKAVNPPVVIKKKDQKARRKQREQKEIKQGLLKKKLEKKKVTDIHRLRHLNKDLVKLQSKLKVMRKRKEKRRIAKLTQPRRIGKHKFQEEDIDVSMPEQISGNLRNVVSEGSLLSLTFKNMQRRNILAPTVDIGLRRRREVKRFVRNTHKEEEVPNNGKRVKNASAKLQILK